MTRWDPGDKRRILQSIADDERRPTHERDAARRELGADQPQSPRRRGRNSDAPITQADRDADIENWYHRDLLDKNLTSSDRNEIFNGFDSSTQAILDAFGSNILWLFTNNEAEVPVLIEAVTNTTSEFIRAKALSTLRAIGNYSNVETAKAQASEFLLQFKENQ
jgi:hypothetical protein